MKEDYNLEDLDKLLGEINNIVNNYDGVEKINSEEYNNDINELNSIIDAYKNISGELKTITKYVNKSNNPDPTYAHVGDSGFDIRASLKESVTLKPLERKLITTGLSFELSPNTELQIRPRSGMALKHGITVLNTPGTVDEGYRGDVGVILVNLSNENYTINDSDRIAQGVINHVIGQGVSQLVNSEELSNTERGSDGFGSTGKK